MTDASVRLTTALADRYRIERELGAGGMATVYLAHDVRHDRKVALKVLRPELSAILGGARFLTEIKTTANLQHPHILSLFDSGEADGLVYYVMPFVEGESLRDRLTREKQLPVDEAVRIAREVADALEYAHGHGVVHRDIKPENVMLAGGHALVADFGIALAASRSDGGTRMTETGMSLGTPHYMSPEQAMGEREITARSDVYALGCVLYEMLTGEPPFTGPTAQAIIARVMTEEPRSVTLQRRTVPPHVEAAVLTALEKLPADRFATAREFGAALAGEGGALPASRITAAAIARTGAGPWRLRFQVASAVALGALAVAAWGWLGGRPGAQAGSEWQRIALGDSLRLTIVMPSMALSPDGGTLVLKDDRQNGLLWIKRRSELNPVPVPGTERGTNPVFSPDGQWIAFVADGRLKKVRTDGGAAVTLADTAASAGGFGGAAWLDDGSLVYVRPSLVELRRVGTAGGGGTVVLLDSTNGGGIGMPHALPGSRGVLYQYCSSGCVTMAVQVLDLRTGRHKPLVDNAAAAWYLPPGRLLYVRRDGVALVAPFDLKRLEITGEAVPVLEGVLVQPGFAQLAWSPAGTLVYVRGSGSSAENTAVRVSRDGVELVVDSAWHGSFASLALSPDGRRAAVSSGATNGGLNIWVKQLDRGPATRLTFSGKDRRPAWSPDGRTVAFVRDTTGASLVIAHAADGSGPDRRLARLDRTAQEIDWTRDGKWLVLRTDNGAPGAGDIVGVRVGGDTTPVSLVASPFTELHPAVSPDGRWLAYTSNESGANEVYVRPFPDTQGARWQVSNGGGDEPRWSPDGRELYYLDPSLRLMAAAVTRGAAFATSGVRPLFSTAPYFNEAFHQSYEVAPDGRSFYFLRPAQAAGGPHTPDIVWVENWSADLRAKLAR
ncbi:MAG TPA: protein kinase [Gemmatimonadales bacterium]|nr:protein kinase [Gemmatimonadales bacterium]